MKESNYWLKFVKEEFDTILLLEESELYRTLCIHAQQLAEKTLKAALFEKGEMIPRIHDLPALVTQLGLRLPVSDEDVQFLSSVYSESRYPSEVGLLPYGKPTEEDAQRAVATARKIHEFVFAHFN